MTLDNGHWTFKIRQSIIIAMGFVIFYFYHLRAETIYIPQDYPTIQEGLYAANAGDSLIVAPGTYSGFMWSGQTKPNITVLGAGMFGDSVTHLVGNVTCDGIYLDDVTGWEVGGFEITNFTSGIAVEHCTDLEIHHCYSHNNPYSHAYGIHLEFCEEVYIHHNVLAYNNYVNMRLNDGNENIRVHNNTIVHCAQYHGIMVMGYQSGLEIINNIIAYNSDSGVKFIPSGCQGDAIITYNDNYSNGSNWFGCTPGVGNISLNPSFTNAPLSPYSLNIVSPCINAGDPAFPLDPDGTIADIGALFFDFRPPAVSDLVITIIGNNANLTWSPSAGTRGYNIYRSNLPYFDITGTIPLSTVNATVFTDSNAVIVGKYYYKVTAVSADRE